MLAQAPAVSAAASAATSVGVAQRTSAPRHARASRGIEVTSVAASRRGQLVRATVQWNQALLARRGTGDALHVRLVAQNRHGKWRELYCGCRRPDPGADGRQVVRIHLNAAKARQLRKSRDSVLSVSQQYDHPRDKRGLAITGRSDIDWGRRLYERNYVTTTNLGSDIDWGRRAGVSSTSQTVASRGDLGTTSYRDCSNVQIKPDTDLSNCDLTGANLNRANLTGANLNRANLNRANLTGDLGTCVWFRNEGTRDLTLTDQYTYQSWTILPTQYERLCGLSFAAADVHFKVTGQKPNGDPLVITGGAKNPYFGYPYAYLCDRGCGGGGQFFYEGFGVAENFRLEREGVGYYLVRSGDSESNKQIYIFIAAK